MNVKLIALVAAAITVSACDEESAVVEPRLHVIAPACAAPAPLRGEPTSRLADHYIVVYKSGTNVRAATQTFEGRFGFTARHYYAHAILGFAATLSAEAVAAIRCDARVDFVEHDAEVHLTNVTHRMP